MSPTKREIHFHGVFSERYQKEPLEIYADSMFNLFNILYNTAYPDLIKEKSLRIAFEDEDGNMTELFDPEQQLHKSQKKIHIIPSADGAWIQVVYAIVAAIIAYGVAMLMAPKMKSGQNTASGANWDTPENVVGQGGIIPVVLGELKAGSRVASYGIDSTTYRSTVK